MGTRRRFLILTCVDLENPDLESEQHSNQDGIDGA